MIFCDETEQDEAVVVGRFAPEEALQLQRELERFRKDALYFDARREQFLATYPERWLAIYEQQVVAAAPDHCALLEHLDAEGIARGSAYRVYVTDDDVDLFL